jgi:hypothetical protein
MKLKLADLQAMLDRLFEHARVTRGLTELEIPENYYWNVPRDVVYDMKLAPGEIDPDVGSLADDWHEHEGLLDGSKAPLVCHLTALASWVRVVGEIGGDLAAKDGG